MTSLEARDTGEMSAAAPSEEVKRGGGCTRLSDDAEEWPWLGDAVSAPP